MYERKDSSVIIHDLPAADPKTGSKGIILTGDRPTGPLHLGHYHGSLKARVAYQDLMQQFILIADQQALTDNFDNPAKVSSNVINVMLDYLSVGIDPKKTTIYIQSQIPETAELMMYFLNLATLGRLMRNPTVKTEAKQRGFDQEMPMGFLCYPVSQTADIAQFKASVVPVGEDQVPMLEQNNDLVRKFNQTYKTDILVTAKALVPKVGVLPGTDGSSKMSKSLNNCIYLSDDTKTVAQKVKGMFTDPNHLRVEDPGTVEGNPVFMYLDAFDPEITKLEEMKAHYRRGGLGDGVVKKRLVEVLEDFLAPIRVRRAQYASDQAQVMALLKDGTYRAREVVAKTLSQVRSAMGINYFS